MPDATRHLQLPNGLHLTLRHAPRLKRASAAIEVRAGSHDAPARWPGLAHFLEHLFFLGTARFPLDDGLMRFVQGVGGQVNASTRERSTAFFFEVPASALGAGLERLCQMLAEPDLSLARQQSEREVIHAEFIAWSRNPQAQAQFARLQSVSPAHPISAFHAGNRYSLPLHDPAFQQALSAFHQRFYRAAQMTLSLCGPQPLEHLEMLGRRFGGLLSAQPGVVQQVPPALFEPSWRHDCKDLLFAHQGLPAGADRALQLLFSHLNDHRDGGWLAMLHQRHWLQRCNVQTLYSFAGQLLWHIDLRTSVAAPADEIRALLHGWFSSLGKADPRQLNVEFSRLQQRRELTASALQLARADSTGMPFSGLDSPALEAFTQLLGDLHGPEDGNWHLPAADPLLLDALPETSGQALPAGLHVSPCLPAQRQFACLHLRWNVPESRHQGLFALLARALQPLQDRADRAGLNLQWSIAGRFCTLRCSGPQAPLLRALALALQQLRRPSADAWQGTPIVLPGLVPIRALLERLPDALLGANPCLDEARSIDQSQLERLWAGARWQGQAIGFDDAGLLALGAVLQDLPGRPANRLTASTAGPRRWHPAPVEDSEQALLLFCPVPARQQAAGRLLAHLLQGPVYQRLRVELQLGYAVFSAYRQIEGIDGLLFGVQSPTASATEILTHLRDLLTAGVPLTPEMREAVAAQFDEPNMPNAEVAQWAWQQHLANQTGELAWLRTALERLQQADIDQLLQALLAPDAPLLCLANRDEPARPWF